MLLPPNNNFQSTCHGKQLENADLKTLETVPELSKFASSSVSANVKTKSVVLDFTKVQV